MARLAVTERRALLVAAAERVLERDGIQELTTRAVTAEAGMNLGHFHYCFRSKAELLEELIAMTVSGLIERAEESVTVSADLDTTLRESLIALWEVMSVTPERLIALYELTTSALRDADLTPLARRQYAGYVGAAEHFLQAVSSATRTRWSIPTAVLSRQLVGVVDGLGLSWLADRDDETVHEVLAAVAAQFAALASPVPAGAGGARDADPRSREMA